MNANSPPYCLRRIIIVTLNRFCPLSNPPPLVLNRQDHSNLDGVPSKIK